MAKVGILGFGNMGGALAGGVVSGGAHEVLVSELKESGREAARAAGHRLVDSASQLFHEADVTVLAVKPQDWDRLSGDLRGAAGGKPVASVMAGVKLEAIRGALGAGDGARMMPNLAARERKALVGICFNEGVSVEFRELGLSIAGAIGTPLEIPERLMAAVTGISGSGIAYAFAFLHAMALGGVKAGLAYPQALEAALTATDGAVSVLRATGENPIEWLSRVVSPAGTTIAGVEALEEGGFSYAVMQAVQRAAARASELEG